MKKKGRRQLFLSFYAFFVLDMNYLFQKLFLLCLLLQASRLGAQHFEWAASAGNTSISYSYSTVDAANNIIIGGETQINYFHHGTPELYNGKGEVSKLKYVEKSDLVVCYSPEGEILWHFQFNTEYTKLRGISHDENGRVVLLIKIEGVDYNEQEEEQGYFYESGKETPMLAGYYLAYYDFNGILLNYKKIFNGKQPNFSINDFSAYPNGGFLITGFAKPGKLCESLPSLTGIAGGDFVMVLDKEGRPDWADVVSYGGLSCCSYFTDGCKASAAPDGTVYFGGTYNEGGTFGGNKTIVTTTGPGDTLFNKPYEAYIACYSPRGKLNWVKTTGQRGFFRALAANKTGVVVSIDIQKSNTLFGEEMDTTYNRTLILAGLDKSGKILWKSTSNADRIHNICFDNKNNIYMLGTMNEIGRCRSFGMQGIIGTDSLQMNTDVFIARFNSNGTYEWVKDAIIPVTTSNEPLLFNMDHCGNLFVTGTLWFSFPAQLSIFDKAFIKGNVYGSAPFISRFKNTLPGQIKEPDSDDPADSVLNITRASMGVFETCDISPGPWKIRNYPNPFTTSTTFEYSISYADYVTLELYDVNGKLLQTLFKNKKHEAGKFYFTFNTTLAAGNYVASIKGTETIATCRIVVGH